MFIIRCTNDSNVLRHVSVIFANISLKSKSTQIFNSINQQLELRIIFYEIELKIEESNFFKGKNNRRE